MLLQPQLLLLLLPGLLLSLQAAASLAEAPLAVAAIEQQQQWQ
jgi:hypothetical protein